MKFLWSFLFIPTIWILAFIHNFFELSLDLNNWYTIPLFYTYCFSVLITIFIGVNKGLKND